MSQASGIPPGKDIQSPLNYSSTKIQSIKVSVPGATPTKSFTSQSSQSTLVEPSRRRRKVWNFWKIERPDSTTPKQDGKPTTTLTLSTVIAFAFFLVFFSIAAHLSIRPILISLMIFGIGTTLALVLACIREYRKGTGVYRPDLGYTILVILMAMPVFTGLYAKVWYPQLRTDILVTSLDLVTKMQFPSIAIFQRDDWTSQGILRNGGSKCFLGWYDYTAPACASLDPSKLGNSARCTCNDFWYNNDDVTENFVWMNTKYRYKVFDSPPWFIGNKPTYMLLLQTFFDYNLSRALKDSSTTNPSLLIAVYDPSLGMQAAFDLGYTRMNLVNANGIIAVNLGLVLRDMGNGISGYDYSLSLASTPATDLVCDTSSQETYKWACHMTLFVQIPNFGRTTITTQKAMTWMDVASSAGGYFSFLQFLSWILSAQAYKGH